ncbi:MAG TPA: hypothetical protein VMV26_19185 [Alphaproteobacteria bacterium]|nr:hypothetical protein [Alphaproteobacteria bacterium]
MATIVHVDFRSQDGLSASDQVLALSKLYRLKDRGQVSAWELERAESSALYFTIFAGDEWSEYSLARSRGRYVLLTGGGSVVHESKSLESTLEILAKVA